MLHVILTRFNIASPGREVAIRNSPGWLDRRFGLFEQFCLPSIAGQTERNFHWLIYFDKDTPAEFRERIERDRQIYNFTPRYVAMFDKAMIADDVKALAVAALAHRVRARGALGTGTTTIHQGVQTLAPAGACP